MSHPHWCVRLRCLDAVGGPHRGALHIVPPDGPPELWWWLVRSGSRVAVAIASNTEPVYMSPAGLAELTRVVAELAE